MALTLTFRAKYHSTSAATSMATDTTYTPAANSLSIAFVCNSLAATPLDPTSVSGHGVSYTKLTLASRLLSTTHCFSIWVAKMGSSPTSAAVTASFGAVSQTGGTIYEYEATGADVAGTAAQAIVQNNVATGTSNNVTSTNLLAAAGNAKNGALAFWIHLANEAGGTYTAGSFTSGHASAGFNTPPTTGGAQHTTGTYSRSPQASWSTSSAYSVAAVEVKADLVHPTSGAIVGPGTTLAGTASSQTTRAASGALVPTGPRRTDSFTRADSTSALGTPSDGGSAWTVSGSTVYGIKSNRAYVETNGTGIALLNAGTANAAVQLTFAVATGSLRLVVRASDSSNFIHWDQFGLQRRQSGSDTFLSAFSTTFSAGDVLKLSIDSSNNITAWQNGVLRGSASSSFNSTQTTHGFGLADVSKNGAVDDLTIWAGDVATVVAGTATRTRVHATSGALVGAGAAVAGTSASAGAGVPSGFRSIFAFWIGGGTTQVAVTHATTGALVGQGAQLSGTAARTRVHATSGALTGQGATVAGTAVHRAKHGTSGVLVGSNSTVAGTAHRTRIHATSGVLPGKTAVIAGTAARVRIHTSTGVLAGPGATLSGAADHIVAGAAHGTSGVLVGVSALAGTAQHKKIHATSGAIAGAGATVAGTARRTRTHAVSGVLPGKTSVVQGTASRLRAHGSSGLLVAAAAQVAGTARRFRTHSTTGVLAGAGSVLAGEAFHSGDHLCTGALAGPGAILVGASAIKRIHDTTGDLVGPGADLDGEANPAAHLFIDPKYLSATARSWRNLGTERTWRHLGTGRSWHNDDR